jgi:hypothetical protein
LNVLYVEDERICAYHSGNSLLSCTVSIQSTTEKNKEKRINVP